MSKPLMAIDIVSKMTKEELNFYLSSQRELVEKLIAKVKRINE